MGRRATAAALVLAACCEDALAHESFTTNAICKKNNCINPIFPGMEDLSRLEAAAWQCQALRNVMNYTQFCRAAVHYDPALPNPDATNGVETKVEHMVRQQDMAASTAFFYHMAGLGLEAWDYPRPDVSDDDCVKSIWRMVCYTYFPRAQLGCQVGMPTKYMRPCQSSCHNYIRQCGVECCDESVQCVFQHTKMISPVKEEMTFGYEAHDGPSSLCTGAARRMQAPGFLLVAMAFMQSLRWFGGEGGSVRRAADKDAPPHARRRLLWLAAPLSAVAMSLQGCDVDIPTHKVGNWRAEPDYLLEFEFLPPGADASYATLNSCNVDRLAPTLQCNGRGVCKMWNQHDLTVPSPKFCECSRDWADPECRTRRKSQVLAFLLSIVLGPLGADQFYLGFWYYGTFKLFTLGGFGVWWIFDIVRIGSAPVQTRDFKLAGDLPHWVFVLITVNVALFIGFVISWITAARHSSRRRKDVLLLQAEEEARALGIKKSGQQDVLRQAGADPGQKVPEVIIPGHMAAHERSQAQFYGSMNMAGQVPVSPADSMQSFGSPNEDMVRSRGRPKPGPWHLSTQQGGSMNMPPASMVPASMPMSGTLNPTPPGTMPPPPPMGNYGTVYTTPVTPGFLPGTGYYDDSL